MSGQSSRPATQVRAGSSLRVVASFLLIVLCVLAPTACAGGSEDSGGRQLLAFVSDADAYGGWEIFTANADGPQRLTHGQGAAASPVWSPDGRKIAFVGTWKRVTASTARARSTSWTPMAETAAT